MWWKGKYNGYSFQQTTHSLLNMIISRLGLRFTFLLSTLHRANKVLVHTKSESQFLRGQSYLVAQLSTGQSHTVSNFENTGQTLHIDVTSINTSSTPSVAQVNIYLGNCSPGVVSASCGTCVVDSDCSVDPSDTCSEPSCVAGQCTTKPAEGCATFELDLLTDNYPQETSWKLLDDCNNGNVVAQGGSFSSTVKEESFESNVNLPWSKYTLVVEDSENDGMCCGYGNGYYEARWNEQRVASGGEFQSSESNSFGSCGAAPTKAPVAPTESPTDAPTGSGGLFELNLLTDNYPGETTWTLVDDCNNGAVVLTGGPYATKASSFVTPDTLPRSKYTFTITDAESDGICCGQYGDGSYTVKWDNAVIQTGGQFQATDTVSFGECSSASNPTVNPTAAPTSSPTKAPTKQPTSTPTKAPTKVPTSAPTKAPTKAPTRTPTSNPTKAPTKAPTRAPTKSPTKTPTTSPTTSPTAAPNNVPTAVPTSSPTGAPNQTPTTSPTSSPTKTATSAPTGSPVTPNSENAVFELNILTDNYPAETTWTLRDDCNIFNTVVASGGPFAADDKGVNFAFSEALPRSKYTLTITDSENDGICCGYGQGSYTVSWDGAFVATGGEFATTDTVTFGECEPVDNSDLFALNILTDN